ncbi:MAG: protein kinase [bacterium]
MIQKGQVVGGRYVIEAQLGQGGMGAVYRAVQQPLGRQVAIKVLRLTGLTPEENHHRQQRFFREAAFSSRLNHQHTVTVYDYGELPGDDGFFIAMELLQGQTLSELIRRGPMSVAMALHIATQIASSLADAPPPASSTVTSATQRDARPARAEPYFVKVVDFGTVRNRGNLERRRAGTQERRRSADRPCAMAPERFLCLR